MASLPSQAYIATCPQEGQTTLAAELSQYGASQVHAGYKCVHFLADRALAYRLHLQLATASCIYQLLREFRVEHGSMLQTQAGCVAWPKLFAATASFRVDGIAGDRGPRALTGNEISRRVRLAIEDAFGKTGRGVPQVAIKDPVVVIRCLVRRGRASLSVLTSGKALHKRGYRLAGHPAPLKETLAATMLRLAGYDGSQAFMDPMCGSGTLAIEAAYIAMGKAANIHRKKGQFALESLKTFEPQLWRRMQEQLRQQKVATPTQPIFAADLNGEFVQAARANALRARVERHIGFRSESFFASRKPVDHGILMMNLPYGERLAGGGAEFYRQVGDHLKQHFSGWQAYLLVPAAAPWQQVGLRPQRRISLMNGAIATKLLVFDLYAGSRKRKHQVAPQPSSMSEHDGLLVDEI